MELKSWSCQLPGYLGQQQTTAETSPCKGHSMMMSRAGVLDVKMTVNVMHWKAPRDLSKLTTKRGSIIHWTSPGVGPTLPHDLRQELHIINCMTFRTSRRDLVFLRLPSISPNSVTLGPSVLWIKIHCVDCFFFRLQNCKRFGRTSFNASLGKLVGRIGKSISTLNWYPFWNDRPLHWTWVHYIYIYRW